MPGHNPGFGLLHVAGTGSRRHSRPSLGYLLFWRKMYEMLTGLRPFQAETAYALLNAHLNEAPEPPDLVNPLISPEPTILAAGDGEGS